MRARIDNPSPATLAKRAQRERKKNGVDGVADIHKTNPDAARHSKDIQEPRQLAQAELSKRVKALSTEIKPDFKRTLEHVKPAVIARPSVAPARVRDATGRFPSRVPLCDPCSVEQYEHALVLMRVGETVAVILEKTGSESWQAIQERGFREYPDTWPAAVVSYKQARIDRLADRAQAVVELHIDAMRTETQNSDGSSTRTAHRRTDSAMIQAAAGLIDPDTHGKGAGRQDAAGSGPQVIVQIVASQVRVLAPRHAED
jgi:hypothetical protein